jgi:hypothetical protein
MSIGLKKITDDLKALINRKEAIREKFYKPRLANMHIALSEEESDFLREVVILDSNIAELKIILGEINAICS